MIQDRNRERKNILEQFALISGISQSPDGVQLSLQYPSAPERFAGVFAEGNLIQNHLFITFRQKGENHLSD